jgi:serpin B
VLRISTYLLLLGSFLTFENATAASSDNKLQQSLIEGSQLFAFDMYRQTSKSEGNLFFSPYSISTGFAMTAAGAQGDTAEQMMQVLHMQTHLYPAFFSLNKQLVTVHHTTLASPTLQLANAAWVQKQLEIQPAFQRTLMQDFGSSMQTVNFSGDAAHAIETINQWVDQNTKGKIKNILTTADVSQETRLVLTSAIYMKAQWLHHFKRDLTRTGAFHLSSDKTQDATFMGQTAHFPLFVDDTSAVLELPYVKESAHGPDLAMMIVLPKDKNGLDKLEAGLSASQWHGWLDQMKTQRVHVVMPKFKLETRTVLNELMQTMGMKLAFTPKADFSGITSKPDLYISKAIHQTFIEVDEKGTEAAAATAISMNLTSMLEREDPYEFVADHPFVFIIFDKNTDVILFMGRFARP